MRGENRVGKIGNGLMGNIEGKKEERGEQIRVGRKWVIGDVEEQKEERGK